MDLPVDPLATLAERLPDGAVTDDPSVRAARARDHWTLGFLRDGAGSLPGPRGVVFPTSTEDVSTVLAWARETETPIVPRGAGSGVCGGAEPGAGSVVLDLSRMDRVLWVDERSMAVAVEAGVRGSTLEHRLNERGLTTGHFPQSLAISSVGGWIATRSAGQASAGYGVIEDHILGLTAVVPGGGIIRLRPTPRSAAGPDLRRLFAGSEGTVGVITEAVLSVDRWREPWWQAVAPASFEEGLDLVRRHVQDPGLRSLVVRLYDEDDARLAFAGVGHTSGPVLLLGCEHVELGPVGEALRRDGARPLDRAYGEHWWRHRNDAVDLYRRVMGKERILGHGVAVDTMEIAGLWTALPELYRKVRGAILVHAASGGCHLSHPYPSGGSLYFTFLIRSSDDRAVEREYLACWEDAAEACHGAGGTITHHHGVGILKVPFMERELGEGGLGLLRSIKEAVDPTGVLNPGKLIP